MYTRAASRRMPCSPCKAVRSARRYIHTPTPTPTPTQGRNPTLPAFSLADRAAIITGGARGLGLAMSRALVLSGADLAIVDLHSTSPTPAFAQSMMR